MAIGHAAGATASSPSSSRSTPAPHPAGSRGTRTAGPSCRGGMPARTGGGGRQHSVGSSDRRRNSSPDRLRGGLVTVTGACAQSDGSSRPPNQVSRAVAADDCLGAVSQNEQPWNGCGADGEWEMGNEYVKFHSCPSLVF